MAPSPHGSARLLRLLRHEKQDEKKALAMASADFAPAEHRTQLIPDYTYKRGGSAGDDSSSTQKTPAGDYYGQNYDGGVHTGTNGAVSREARSVLRENAAQERAERDVHRGALGALDVVPEKDENVLGSLGGVEAFDSRNRDGVLLAPEVASTDRNVMMNLERKHYRNTMGSLFSVHAPSNAEDAADAKMKRPRNALSFRYRQGHWSHDGLLWIVGLSLSSSLALTFRLPPYLCPVRVGSAPCPPPPLSSRRRGHHVGEQLRICFVVVAAVRR
jgi:hypothetical protein